MAKEPTIEVRDEPDAAGGPRFTVHVDGERAGYAAYHLDGDGRVVFSSTKVDDAHEGQGVGSALAAGALGMVRERGRRAVARCPFIEAFVDSHPEWADLVDR